MSRKIKISLMVLFIAFINSLLLFVYSENFLFQTLITVTLISLIFFVIMLYESNKNSMYKKQCLVLELFLLFTLFSFNLLIWVFYSISYNLLLFHISNLMLFLILILIVLDTIKEFYEKIQLIKTIKIKM